MSQQDCCCICIRGLYSCHWQRKSRGNERKHACCWFSVIALVSLLSLCWMYICLVTFNDQEDVNAQGFKNLKRWVNWFMVVIIISAVLTCYSVLLLLFALFQVALGEQLDLHCFHRIFLILGVIIITLGFIGISLQWKQEWPTVPLSLQATGPFLQFGAVGALMLLSCFVFQCYYRAKNARSKVLIAVVFVTVSVAIYLCPLVIRSPCLMELSELPVKPNLIGHRGAPMVAPENTMMSFNSSIACGVTTFETDVQVSKDRIPFLMHDHGSGFLLRTTDAEEKFPGKHFRSSTNLTWEELQTLNAGDWFVKTDPFRSVGQLSEKEKEAAQNQTIPSLLQLLNLAKQHNISVIFDLYSPDQAWDTNDTVNTILRSGIDPSLILWLPPAEREAVSLAAPGFIQVYNDENEMLNKGGNHLNLKYNNLSTEKIRELRKNNVTVNLWVVNEPWLFSLLWCSGASSVTTNSCHQLNNLARPIWLMSPGRYKIIWILVDVSSFVVMIVFYFIPRRIHGLCLRREDEKSNKSNQRAQTSAKEERSKQTILQPGTRKKYVPS